MRIIRVVFGTLVMVSVCVISKDIGQILINALTNAQLVALLLTTLVCMVQLLEIKSCLLLNITYLVYIVYHKISD